VHICGKFDWRARYISGTHNSRVNREGRQLLSLSSAELTYTCHSTFRAARLLHSSPQTRFHTFSCKESASMNIDSLDVLFHEELKDVYSAESQLVKALPKMAKAWTRNPRRIRS
jgi:Domain of unknown function (DUF892)